MTALTSAKPAPVLAQTRAEPSVPKMIRPPDANGGARALGDRAGRADVTGDGTHPAAMAEAVAKAFSGSNNLRVDSFHDEATGRFVTRVSDRWSGRVLVQTPPDELLRFLASGAELEPETTRIDA